MSGGLACKQHDRKYWRIVHYRHNHSAFNGYHRTPSQYSQVECIFPGCWHYWSTKAKYVDNLPMLKKGEAHQSKSEGCM